MARPAVAMIAAIAAALWLNACTEARGEVTGSAGTAAGAAGSELDAERSSGPGCHVTVTGDRTATLDLEERPGLVASDHWFTDGELSDLGEGYGSLLVSCVGDRADVALWAGDPMAVPLQPGDYGIGPSRPFSAQGRIDGEAFGASDGHVHIERFDLGGVRAVASIPMVSTLDPAVTVAVTLTVDLGCTGVSLCA